MWLVGDRGAACLLFSIHSCIHSTQVDAAEDLSSEKRAHLAALRKSEPNLLGWLVTNNDHPKVMKQYIDALCTEDNVVKASGLFASSHADELAYWMSEVASQLSQTCAVPSPSRAASRRRHARLRPCSPPPRFGMLPRLPWLMAVLEFAAGARATCTT